MSKANNFQFLIWNAASGSERSRVKQVHSFGQASRPETSVQSEGQVVNATRAVRFMRGPVAAAVGALVQKDPCFVCCHEPVRIPRTDSHGEQIGSCKASGPPVLPVVTAQEKSLVRSRQQDIGSVNKAPHGHGRQSSDLNRPAPTPGRHFEIRPCCHRRICIQRE